MSLLEKKYKILGQEASTHALEAQNLGALQAAQATAIPQRTAADAALAYSQAYRTGQEGANVTPLAKSEIGLRGAQAGYSGALARQIGATFDPNNLSDNTRYHNFRGLGHYDDGTGELGAPAPITFPISTPIALGAAAQDQLQDQQQDAYDDGGANRNPQYQMPTWSTGGGYSGGTPKVPGQGSGKVDTVPAMLAPGEAVLNKGAAEHIGRGMIAQLNKLGLNKMAAGAEPNKSKKMNKGGMVSYAMGIDEVPAIAATSATQGTQGGIKNTVKLPTQKHAKGTAKVESSAQPDLATGDGDSIKDRNKALTQDKNDKLHMPSMVHGMQLMAVAMGMPSVRQGFSRGTAKVAKGRHGSPMMAPSGAGPLGLTPATASMPNGVPSPEQISPLLAMLQQPAQGQA